MCKELNEHSLPAVRSLDSCKKKWKCFISEKPTGRMFEARKNITNQLYGFIGFSYHSIFSRVLSTMASCGTSNLELA